MAKLMVWCIWLWIGGTNCSDWMHQHYSLVTSLCSRLCMKKRPVLLYINITQHVHFHSLRPLFGWHVWICSLNFLKSTYCVFQFVYKVNRDAIRHVCASWKCLWLCTKTTWKRIETVEFYQKERERSLWWVLNSVRGREHSYIGRWCSHC